METWLIAVIASAAAVVAAVLIGVFVFLCRRCCASAEQDIENQVIVTAERSEANEPPLPGQYSRLFHWLHHPQQSHVEREHTASGATAPDKRLKILKPIYEAQNGNKFPGQRLDRRILDQERVERHVSQRERIERQKLKSDQQKLEQQRLEQQKLEQQKLEQQKLRQQILQQNFWLEEEADVVFRDPDKTLDLHYLYLEEALMKFRHFLRAMEIIYSNNNHRALDRFIHVITGRGLHSKNGIPKIKPAVQDYLDSHGYSYTWKNNGGMVTIDLSSRRRNFT